MQAVDLTGQRFGALVVRGRSQSGKWQCKCDCGAALERALSALREGEREGARQSCGCARLHGSRVKWALTWQGELRTLTELSRASGVARHALERYARRGVLTAAFMDALLERRAMLAARRAAGVSDWTHYARRKAGWDAERAATAPVRGRGRAA